jgi:glycosyltransferase involved in cell wall biosynthesis
VRSRILYVVESIMAGGIESQLVELVLRLNPERFEPYVLALYGERARRSPHFAAHLRASGIPFEVMDIGWGMADKVHAARRIAGMVRAIHPDLVELEGYHANLLARAVRPWMPPTQLIGTVRGIETRKQLIYQRIGQRLCDRIVASSPELEQMLVQHAGVPAEKVVVIPNAVDVSRFAAPTSAATALRRDLAPEGQRVLLSVGRVAPQKRLHLIAEALGLLEQQGRLPEHVRICLLGQVEDAAMQARLDASIAAYDLKDVIIQRPPTTTPEDYYHASDVTILYSLLEGISIAMLESLASGRPVIISEEANAAGIVEDGRTGWVVPTHDLARFAETLAMVIALPEVELLRMRGACQLRAQEYSIDALVQRYNDLYESLMGTSQTRVAAFMPREQNGPGDA